MARLARLTMCGFPIVWLVTGADIVPQVSITRQDTPRGTGYPPGALQMKREGPDCAASRGRADGTEAENPHVTDKSRDGQFQADQACEAWGVAYFFCHHQRPDVASKPILVRFRVSCRVCWCLVQAALSCACFCLAGTRLATHSRPRVRPMLRRIKAHPWPSLDRQSRRRARTDLRGSPHPRSSRCRPEATRKNRRAALMAYIMAARRRCAWPVQSPGTPRPNLGSACSAPRGRPGITGRGAISRSSDAPARCCCCHRQRPCCRRAPRGGRHPARAHWPCRRRRPATR